jgi:hypothetical protein
VTHPFSSLSARSQRRALAVATAATLAVSAALQVICAPLVTAEAPLGIVSFEFAGDLDTMQLILSSWGEPGRMRAALALGLDFLFLVLYAAAIALACGRVAERWGPTESGVHRLGAALAWGALLAGVLDAVENTAGVMLLLGSQAAAWAPLAAVCAAVKFAGVAAGLAYAAIGFGVTALQRKSEPGVADKAGGRDEGGDRR